MRIGTVLIASGREATVYLDDLDIRVKCRIVKGVMVKANDNVAVELFSGCTNGVIIGVM